MNKQKLLEDIDQTREEIYRLMKQIETTENPKELLRLKRILKGTRLKQFRYIEQLG